MRSEPALAVLRLVTCSRRELASSMAMMAFLLLLAGFHQAPRWMPLAATLLAAWLAAAACLALLHLVFPPDARWWWAWLALLPALAIGAGAGWLAYGTLPFASFGMTRPVLGDAPLLGTGLAFCALTFGVPLLQAQRQAQALQLANLKHAALQAQLKSLQAQVEPHFLFNTLSNTRYLARHAPEQAVTMLDHLIAYLRAALPDLRSAASTVGRECELARHYLALMAIRFGARLTTEVACPPQLAPLPLPPLLLMSLVENAVRHGVEPKAGNVTIRVSCHVEADHLHLLVADNGAGLDGTVAGTGIGLRNLRERIAALYGAGAAFELRSGAAGWTEASLMLPLGQHG